MLKIEMVNPETSVENFSQLSVGTVFRIAAPDNNFGPLFMKVTGSGANVVSLPGGNLLNFERDVQVVRHPATLHVERA